MTVSRLVRLVGGVTTSGLLAAGAVHPIQAQDYGPGAGALVLAGGGAMEGTGIIERFIELGGGAESGRFVIVPTAAGNHDEAGNVRVYRDDRVLAPWRARGLVDVTMLHTADREVADTAAFVAALTDATAVWFNGGRQWRIVDSYAGTRAYDQFHQVLARGGVIGGSSAGATIQGHYLVRGDTRGPHIMMTDEPHHQRGFEFLRRSAVDQHVDARQRWDDLIPVIDRQPELLGLGLSEGTAIVVTGDTFEVIGRSTVAVHDRTGADRSADRSYLLLHPGDRYDMRARRRTTP